MQDCGDDEVDERRTISSSEGEQTKNMIGMVNNA